MATVQHSAITDPNIHEPKGVAAATVNKLYVSNGNGSGTWKKLSPPQLSGLTTNGQAGDTITPRTKHRLLHKKGNRSTNKQTD